MKSRSITALALIAALETSASFASAQPFRNRPTAPFRPQLPAVPNPPPPPVAGTTPGSPPPAAAGAPGAGDAGGTTPPTTIGPNGKAIGDTASLSQFETGIEYAPRSGGDKVSFSLEDADLSELVRVIGELTGKRFIFGGKVRNIKATVFSPQKVTVAEAYQAFLSILDANGLTVVPHGRFYEIIDAPDAKGDAPVYVAGQAATNEDRFITRIHRPRNASADDIANVLGKFKSKDGDITVYGPGNLLIITDTGANINRMMRLLEDIDVGGVGEQIWIEPIHYSVAADIAARLNDVFDIKAPAKPGDKSSGGDVHITKIIADDRSNSIIIIGTERAYLRVLEFIKRLDIPHTGEGEIHVLALQHADATDLAKTLTDIVTAAAGAGAATPRAGVVPLSIFESGVKISADKATNSIVITSSLRDFASLRSVIDQLDQARRQVFIEAAIMDLTIDRENQLGVAFHGGDVANGPSSDGQTLLYGGLNPFKSIGLPTPGDPTLNALALGIRGPSLPGSANFLGTGITIPAFGVLLNALASTNDADILSTPHILATDNVPAEISVGQNIPLQTNVGGIGSLPTTSAAGSTATSALGALGALGGLGAGFGTAPRQDIGTKIKITPHLNDSDEVRLEVSEEISDVTGEQALGSLGAVPFAKRTAQTQLVVKDQQTVVIGGLVRNRIARTDTKIPLLGDIPLLGVLFRSSSTSLQKSNLILVLTPYIIREQADLRAVFERKMQERQEFLDHYFVFSDETDYQPPKDYSRTNGLLEDVRESYRDLSEKRRIEELTRPREMKTHEPGQPIDLPAAPSDTGDVPQGTLSVQPAQTTPAQAVPATAAPAPGSPPPVNGPPPGSSPPSGGPPPPPSSPPPPPTLNVSPPPRSVDRVEK